MTPTIAEALEAGRRQLQPLSSSAQLDAQVLLAAALARPRTWLLAHGESELSGEAALRYGRSIEQVLAGEALPHVVGQWEFYGRPFRVGPGVLIPRPETEGLVEAALELVRRDGRAQTVLDVGTGSGCLAVTLALELPQAVVVASDLSRPALAIARQNCLEHRVGGRVRLLQADLLKGLAGRFDLVCANLPYVRSADYRGALQREPRLALDGGADGLRLIRGLLSEAPRCLAPGGGAVLEVDPRQAGKVARLAADRFPQARVEVRPDLAGLDRVVVIRSGGRRAD